MSEILEQAKSLIVTLQSLIASVNKDKVDNDLFAKKLNEQDAELVEKAKALIAREHIIKPIENVMEMKHQAVALKKEADELLHNVRKEKQEFNDQKAADLAEMAKSRDQIKIDRANADNEIAKAQKEWIALKTEQDTWKAKFFEEIKQKVK